MFSKQQKIRYLESHHLLRERIYHLSSEVIIYNSLVYFRATQKWKVITYLLREIIL